MCTIDNESSDLVTMIDCSVTMKSTGLPCGKRPLRADERREMCSQMENKKIHVLDAKRRRELQNPGDGDPPMCYTENVMSTAKSQDKKARTLHRDPIVSLGILKRSPLGKDVIQNIGYDPFSVIMFSNYQIRLWNLYSDKVPLIIDATSGIATKLIHADGQKSRSLFLHLAVINCNLGQ